MASLADVRAKYPEYEYLSDGELADAMHKKFYADMPRAEFDKRIGVSSQPAPSMSAGEVAADVAKSAGIGLVQGGIGLATLPGNLEALARTGINAVAGVAGARPPVSGETFLPTYPDWKGKVEQHTGQFYKPQSTLGEYARTAGEFAPLAVGGAASAANRLARVALPAGVSETAGQLTEGTALEPWARAAGALVGARAPNTAARAVTPAPANPARQNAIQTLEKEGVTALTAGQRTGSERLRWIEDATAMVPGGRGKVTAMQEQAAEQFTRAALKKAGVNADRADPATMDKAFSDLGNQFSALASRNDMIQSRRLTADLKKALDDYKAVTAEPLRAPIIEKAVTEFAGGSMAKNGPYIPGRVYQNVRSDLSRQLGALRFKDPPAAMAVRDIIASLDRAMEASIKLKNPGDIGAFRKVRGDYRNLLAIEDAVSSAGEAAASGLITPAALRNAAKKQSKRDYVRGKGDLGNFSRAGVEAGLTPLRSSGTAERTFAQGVVGAPSVIGTGVGGYMGAGDPILMLAGALAPPVMKAATARAIMSGPAQRYFSNQRLPQTLEPIPVLPSRTGFPGVAPLAAAQAERDPSVEELARALQNARGF